jgi:hypothetical protein
LADSNPAEGHTFLRTIQIHSTTFFGVVVKPSAQNCEILRYVEEPFKKGKIFCRLNSSFYFSSSFYFATAFRIAREL